LRFQSKSFPLPGFNYILKYKIAPRGLPKINVFLHYWFGSAASHRAPADTMILIQQVSFTVDLRIARFMHTEMFI